MRFATLFFNPTLYKKHLQRYWPIAAVWGAVWLLAIPVQLWNSAQHLAAAGLANMAGEYADYLDATAAAGAVFAIITAVAVMFHLFKAPATNFIGALPVTRECVFLTAFAAGYTLLAGPLALVAAITLGVEAALGVVNGSIVLWLGGGLLSCFFWLCFSILCCVITGNGVAGAAFYAIFNAVVIAMTSLVEAVVQMFLFGFSQFGDGVEEAVLWLTPLARLSGDLFGVSQKESYWYVLWVYAGVGFLMLLAALGLHHIRKSERAGDLIAFQPLRLVFKICVAVCGGLSLGMLLLLLIFDGLDMPEGLTLAVCCAVTAAISYYISEMLLRKTLKVFKKCWKGAVISAVGLALVIAAIDMDWIGFTTRVPQPETVKSASLVVNRSASVVGSNGLVYTGEDVEDLVALHQYLVERRDELDQSRDGQYVRLELTYDLGMTSLRREYRYYIPASGDSSLREITENALRAGVPTLTAGLDEPAEMYVCRNTEEEGYLSYACGDGERQAIWAAFMADVKEGNYRASLEDSEGNVWLELTWRVTGDGGAVVDYRTQTCYITKDCAHTAPMVGEIVARQGEETGDASADTSKAGG